MRYLYLLLILIPTALLSQSINLYNINTDNFPLIEADFFITDFNGEQVSQVTTDDFIIREKQREKIINEVSCSSDSVINKISTVLTLDLSSSMRGAKFEWIKEASSAWISQMDSLTEETAITTFDDEALLYSDYNFNKQSLLDIVQTLELRDGTNFKTAFLDPYAGALDVARRADYKPIIVFLTDGVGTSDFDVDEVVTLAKSMNATVYAISLEITLPDEIKKVTDATGGLYFEQVNDKDRLIDIYNTIRKIAVSTSPCKISWFTDGCLIGKESNISFEPLGISKDFSFDAPGIEPPQFEYLGDEFVEFSCQKPNIKVLRLKALNSDIDIESIDKVSGFNICNQFKAKVNNKEFPFTLKKDSVIEIEIEYLGSNSNYNLCQFTINSSTCLNVNFYAVSNCIGSPPSNVVVKVIKPNGGEIIKSGSRQNIFWNGTKSQKNKIVEYSLDNGKSWSTINQGKLVRSTEWLTPNVFSENCLVRIKQMSEEAGRKLFSINVDSSNIKKISWNNAGNVFAALTDSATIYIVNSVIGQIANEYKLNNAEKADINFLPDGVRLLYSSDSETSVINLITQEYLKISSFGGEIELSFSNDIGIVHNNNSVHILDLNSMNFIYQFDIPDIASEITDAAISKSSEHIVISTSTNGRSDSLYILSKLEDWSNVNQSSMVDNIFNHSYNHVEWSHDEEYIISTSSIGNQKWLELWDFDKREKIHKKLNPTFTRISDLATSDYDNYVVMTDAGFNVLVWEWDESIDSVFTLKYEFQSQANINNDIEWSKDGTRFAVGQSGFNSDSLVTIYSIKPYPESLDISDSTFSLVKNTFTIEDINMGDVLVNNSKDSIFDSVINYEYEFEFEVDSIEITGTDKDNFSVSNSPNLPTLINKEMQPKFLIEFKPTKIGLHSSNVIVYSKYGSSDFLLLGNGKQPIVETRNISFDEVNVDKEKKLIETVVLNNGNIELKINSIEIVSPSSRQFQLYNQGTKVNSIEDINVIQGGSLDLGVSFTPDTDIIFNSRLRVIYEADGADIDTTYIKLDGRGIEPNFLYSNKNVGIVKCDENVEDTLKLKNVGTGVLIINEIKLNSVNFKFRQSLEGTYEIEEGDSLSLGIIFDPEDNGIIKDSVIFLSNNQSDSLSVLYLNGRKLETSFDLNGNSNLIGVDNNKVYNEDMDIFNSGRTILYWNTPAGSTDGKITINNVTPNPTLPGETSKINYTFNGGNKGEVFSYKFSPEPICSDSIEIKVEIKSTSPTLYTNVDEVYKIVCENELNITIPFTNIGEAQLNIDSVSIANNTGNIFSIENKNFQLNSNQSDSLNLYFTSDTPDIYTVDLIIYSNDSKSNDGKTTIPITVVKELSKFKIIENGITFSYLNNNIPNSKTVKVVNEGTVPIRWDITLDNNFTIYSVVPQIAQPGDTTIVTFIHIGDKESSAIHQFAVKDSCENINMIDVNILGIDSERISLSVSNEKRNIGEQFPLSLNIVSSTDFENGEVLKGNLRFNRTLMRPENSINSTVNELRIVPFEIENPKTNQIINIEMEALWGNDSCTTIEITDLVMENSSSNVEFTSENGDLCIKDLCYSAGPRLLKIDFEKQDRIIVNGYDETELSLTINTVEEGAATINIYDFKGIKLREEVINNSKDLQSVVWIDIDDLGTGNYYIQVKTYSQVFNKKLLIIK